MKNMPMSQLEQSNINARKYDSMSYNKKERLINYWNQVDIVLSFKPKDVLEVGVGSKTVYDMLKKSGVEVRGIDINASLMPDIVGSVEKIPLPDNSTDVVLAAEILEHVPFEKFEKCLSEIYRVSKKGAVVSLPHNGATFSFSFKVPLIPWTHLVFKIPYFWRTKPTTPEHYWEVGLKGYPLSKIKNKIKQVGFSIKRVFISHDDTYRIFFILEKS